jgi:bacteriocin biosynthesis cyclodehydratase domain-containing protein
MRPETTRGDRSDRLRQTVLRPGVHVLRRSAEELQVGLDPGRAIVLPDHPAVRQLLDALTSPAATPEPGYDEQTLLLLADGGLLVDADTLLPLLAAQGRAVEPCVVAALAAAHGDAAGELLRARSHAPVMVVGHGGAVAAQLADDLVSLLTESGGRARVAEARAAEDPRESDLVGVLVSVGEPPRELLDGWVRAQAPHLVVRMGEGAAALGPFVRPGETACLRCVDAHHTDIDPAWPLLAAQHATACSRGRADTLPEPVEPALAQLAVAWAAREVLSHLEGRSPAVLSGTLRLDPHLSSLSSQVWPRHPACGCGWS